MKNQVSPIRRSLQLGAVLLLAFGLLVSVSAAVAQPLPPDAPNGVINHVCPDAYDSPPPQYDDLQATAKSLVVDTLQQHNFDGNTNNGIPDKDWVKFGVVRTGVYTLTTSNLGPVADTVIELYDADNHLVAKNDDYTSTFASQIVWTAPTTAEGWYYLSIYNNTNSPATPTNCATVISYTLSLQSKEPRFIFMPLITREYSATTP